VLAERRKAGEFMRTDKGQIKIVALILALCLVCSGVGGAAGALTAYRIFTNKLQADLPKEPDEGEALTVPPALTTEAEVTTEPVTEPRTEKQTEPQTERQTNPAPISLSAKEIFNKTVSSVVAIKTVVTFKSSGILGTVTREGTGSGSGFIYTQNGYIVTNYHVIQSAKSIKVTLHDNKEFDAKLIGYDQENDIAVIKIDAENLNAVTVGSSSELSVGDRLYIIGNPLGELSQTLSQGVVSGLNRKIDTGNYIINMHQTDAAINQGNSGGPVFDENGRVVGIVAAKYASETIESLGFFIPIDDVKTKLNDIMKYGYVRNKPYLGLSVQTVTNLLSLQYRIPVGVYVVDLDTAGPAAKAGVQAKDVITKVGGKAVTSVAELKNELSKFKTGDKVELTVSRSGGGGVFTVTLGELVPTTKPRTNYSDVYDV